MARTNTNNSGLAGVSSLNGLVGAISLAAGANITLTPVGNTITIASTGGGGAGNPALPFNSVQFNDGGVFGGSANYTWDNAMGTLQTSFGGNSTSLIDPSTGRFAYGYYTGGGNGAYLDILDGSYINFSMDSGRRFLVDLVNKSYAWGDIDNQDNGGFIRLDDITGVVDIGNGSNNMALTLIGHSAFGGVLLDDLSGLPIPIVNNNGNTVLGNTNLVGVADWNNIDPTVPYTSISNGGYFRSAVISTNAQDFSGSQLSGVSGIASYAGSNVTNINNILNGGSFLASNESSGNISVAIGTDGTVYNNQSGIIDLAVGNGGTVENVLGGTITLAAGTVGTINNDGAGTITSGYGVVGFISNIGLGTISTAASLLAQTPDNTGGGTINFLFGLNIKDHSGIGTVKSQNIYSEGTNSENVFEGHSAFGGAFIDDFNGLLTPILNNTGRTITTDISMLGVGSSIIVDPALATPYTSSSVGGNFLAASSIGTVEDFTGARLGGIIAEASYNGTFANTNFALTGVTANARNKNSGDVTFAVGSFGDVYNEGNGTIFAGVGFFAEVYNTGIGTITNAIGFTAAINNQGAGTITQAVGLNIQAPDNSGGGLISTNYGVRIADQSGVVGVGGVGGSWNFVSDGSGSINKIEGTLTMGDDGTPGAFYILPNTDGTNGQTLVTDGVGGVTWGTAGGAWSLTGNAGTNPATNFIGTTDAQPLIFKTQTSTISGVLGDVNANTFFGLSSGLVGLSDTGNSGFGQGALTSLTVGGGGNTNSAFGYKSLQLTTSGDDNVGVGYLAGGTNTIGSNNTFIGANADSLTANLTNATAIGYNAKVGANDSIMLGQADTATIIKGRLEQSKGIDVASATDVTLGYDGNTFVITGAVQIETIIVSDLLFSNTWIPGSHITLIFSSAPTVKHNGTGTGAVLLLAGSVDLVAAANTVLGLVYDGTSWQETFRKVA